MRWAALMTGRSVNAHRAIREKVVTFGCGRA